MERAVTHKNIVKFIFNSYDITEYNNQLDYNKENDFYNFTNSDNDNVGIGPIVLFASSATMTVDPVLVQRFATSLETSKELAKSIEKYVNLKAKITKDVDRKIPFVSNPKELSEEPKLWHKQRRRRMSCLLIPTDFVQSFVKLSSGSMFELFSVYFIRPAMI